MDTNKITEAIVSAFVKEVISQANGLVKSTGDEVKQFFELGLKSYIENQYNKFSHIKTILKGNTPNYFYDVYYPINLKNHNHRIVTNSIDNTFEKSKYITVIGEAGSGKSTLVKHLFLRSLNEKKNIPIFVELRYLTGEKNSIEIYIKEKIFNGKITENKSILERMLQAGGFLFFLDGYDEISGETKKSVVDGINSLIDKYPKNKYLLTTRPYSDVALLPSFHNYNIEQLSEENGDIEGFISTQLKDEPELAEQIKKSIKEAKASYIKSFLTNPLLLSLYMLTYQSNASIPSKKYLFYRRVINALFSEHDSKSKLGFEREKKCKLEQEEFEKILKALCFLSYFDSEFSFVFDSLSGKLEQVKKGITGIKFSTHHFIHDMKVAISLWTEDGGIISFAHRSLQEYFAALFIKDLDDANKELVYLKLLKHSEKTRSLSEIENFLSLCEEMDEVSYNKFYALPILDELKTLLAGRDSLNKFLTFFTGGVTLRNTRAQGSKSINRTLRLVPIVNQTVYKSIYFHINFTMKLNNILTKLSPEDVIPKEQLENNNLEEHRSYYFTKTRGMKLKTLTTLRSNASSEQLAKDFIKHINNEISRKNKLITTEEKTNSDLISMVTL